MAKERKERKKKSIAFKIIMSLIMIVVALIGWIGVDIIIGVMKTDAPRRPTEALNTEGVTNLTWVYQHPAETHPDISFTSSDLTAQLVLDNIADTVTYINSKYDCSDFRAIDLIKLYFTGGAAMLNLSPEINDTIEDTLTNFKFWITSEGEDSMCYHSENHEALFAVTEYLSGMMYPDSIFSIDGKNGTEHMAIAKARLLTWMQLRFLYGFSEYYSANYMPVDVAAMSMLVQYGDHSDENLMNDATIMLDLIFYDYASQLYDYTFAAPTGRAYDHNNGIYNETSAGYNIIDYAWSRGNVDYDLLRGGHEFLFIDMAQTINTNTGEPFYEIPEVIIDIGNDSGARINKSSNGLNCSELAAEDLIGLSDRQIMYQLGMGAHTNKEIINNMLDIMNEYDLWSNNFLSSFKYVNINLFRLTGVMPYLMDTMNPVMNGSAIERGNIYTYITDDYKLSTAQSYHPGNYGDQQNLGIATLPDGVTVYTTHPYRNDVYNTTPGYWAGFGVAPEAAQDQNISLSIYNIPKGKMLLAPTDTLQYTHTLFPEELFDEVILDGNYAFGRIGSSYIALIGGSELSYKPYDQVQVNSLTLPVSDTTKSFDLVQEGDEQFWIYEMGSVTNYGTFNEFMSRIKANSVTYDKDNMTLNYVSDSKTLNLTYQGDFAVNNVVQDLEYKRYESEYIVADRKANELNYSFNGHTLYLNFETHARVVG